MTTLKSLVLTLLFALPQSAVAQDFSAGSEAESWNLYAEQPARFEAKVVDALCELTGDCPADCGAGKRQLRAKHGRSRHRTGGEDFAARQRKGHGRDFLDERQVEARGRTMPSGS